MTGPGTTGAGATGLQLFGAQLGALCARHAAPPSRGAVHAAAAAAACALEEGHACVPLAALAGPEHEPLPPPAELRALLRQSGVVGDGRADTPTLPLVLDDRDRLYLGRLFAAEQSLAAALRQRLAAQPPPLQDATLAALRRLPRDDASLSQTVAVAAALRATFTVITGGPGTGKTTTVGRLLEVLRAGHPELRVALAAPTGKASARLGEAIAGQVADAPAPKTLHRLLGYVPLEDRFRRGPDDPLPYDLVVVDEASMVDLELAAALLQALPADARLVLLGDRDQLTSVGTGQVLADLCRAARPERGAGKALAAFCREHLGVELPRRPDTAPLASAVVALRTNWRFGNQPGLDAFAKAVARRDPTAALAALQHGHADLRLLPAGDTAGSFDALLASIWPLLTASLRAPSPEAALLALQQGRVLCATRHGPAGVAATNERVEQLLRREGHRIEGRHYHGRPVLVTANDYQSELFNGDLGVLWRDADADAPVACFLGRQGVRRVPLLRLPPHETAWALTVHKSQGSEFDEVLLLLPDRDSPLLVAPLVYTAVTRARRRATIAGELELVAQALRTEPQRSTGLADALVDDVS